MLIISKDTGWPQKWYPFVDFILSYSEGVTDVPAWYTVIMLYVSFCIYPIIV